MLTDAADPPTRLRLDPLTVSDAAEMVGVLSAPELYAVTGGEPPTLDELTERYRRQVVGRSADGREEWLNWVVRVNDEAVGFVQATVTDGSRAAVAWVIGRAWQGRGLATAAAEAMLAELRLRGVTTVEAWIAPGHEPSEKVAARIGLAATGRTDDDGERLWLLPQAPR
jgi:RimJ/RimL family protein N-acetyltransferase